VKLWNILECKFICRPDLWRLWKIRSIILEQNPHSHQGRPILSKLSDRKCAVRM
jgi:hypothetical protein